MAPPNSRIFSVSVVLPASGCEMIAKVRRRATGLSSGMGLDLARGGAYLMRTGRQGKGRPHLAAARTAERDLCHGGPAGLADLRHPRLHAGVSAGGLLAAAESHH